MIRLQGVVVHGKGEAKNIGYPTANIDYASPLHPENGVWTCRVNGKGQGLAVIGMWSLANGLPSLEVHLLDFEEDLYGQTLDVVIEKKVRDLKSFATVEELIEQIKHDARVARNVCA